ncbi:MAG: NAD-dependent deacylase [Saprospiraceae bacterium]|nr:NAD-dependent deacylase [Saprospiraceae bacterium]
MTEKRQTIIILTGAGMSAESGIKTFRDSNGLWENHNVMDVASPEGFAKNPALVLEFYNQRRRQLFEVEPNAGHKALTELEDTYNVVVVTQNVDDLHERAGTTHVVHLHGELRKVRSVGDESLIYDCTEDINIGDTCEKGHQLRPHIVWFGEAVPMYERAFELVKIADYIIVIGTSMQVYPAAGLVYEAPKKSPVFFIDPKPQVNKRNFHEITIIAEPATTGVRKVVDMLK